MRHLEAAHASLGDRASISFDDFQRAVQRWEVIPVDVNGEVAGAVLLKGPEVHACILERFKRKWVTKSLYKTIFQDRLNKYGKLITSVQTSCEEGTKFVTRCGFKKIGEASGIAHFERVLDGH